MNLTKGFHLTAKGYIRMHHGKEEHVLIAERAFGGPLPPGAQVHHVDGNPSNNRNDNLVICPDQIYHGLLHVRARALDACGNANWRKCTYCKKWDDPQNLYLWKHVAHHRKCNSEASKRSKRRKVRRPV